MRASTVGGPQLRPTAEFTVTADAEPQEALLPTWSLRPPTQQEGASSGEGWKELENAALSPVDSEPCRFWLLR